MKKLILSLIISIFLISSLSFAYPYKLDPIMETIKKQGKTLLLTPDNLIAFLEFHSADRSKTHNSFYISVFFSRVTENVFLPNILAFIKEEWILENSIWTIKRSIINDIDFDENTDTFQCEILKEDLNGRVASIDSMQCEVTDKSIIDEILEKTAFKVRL